jgi:hypothetical protein
METTAQPAPARETAFEAHPFETDPGFTEVAVCVVGLPERTSVRCWVWKSSAVLHRGFASCFPTLRRVPSSCCEQRPFTTSGTGYNTLMETV